MKKIASTLLLSAAISAPAFAADEGAFVNLDIGQANYSSGQVGIDGKSSSSQNGYRIGGGYNFTRYVGVEADYYIIGSQTITGVGTNAGLSTSDKTKAMQITANGTYPINEQFDVIGKLGIVNLKADGTLTAGAPQNAGVIAAVNGATYSGSKTNVMYGLGGQYNINKQVAVRMEYEVLGSITPTSANANLNFASTKLSYLSLGLVYKF